MDPPRIAALHFLAAADLRRSEVEAVVAAASRRLAVPCHLASNPWPLEIPPLAGRRERDADWLLARAAERGAHESEPVVVLTGLDLAIPIFTFVFGRAQRGGRAAVVSLARLRPEFYGLAADTPLTLKRAVATILHELGHVAGLGHCAEGLCLMRFAASVERLDLRGGEFCPACRAALPPGLLAAAPPTVSRL